MIPPSLDRLRQLRLLRDIDVVLARRLCALAAEDRPEVALAVALASRWVGDGHVCLDLDRLEPLVPERSAGDQEDSAGAESERIHLPEPEPWLHALRASAVVGAPDAATPLVLDGSRLYLRRYWDHQRRLADAIRARTAPREDLDEAALADGLARLFVPSGQGAPAAPDWQRVAALMALRSRFCVISGGPGTGKTFTVVKILALIVEQALARGEAAPRMTLVAPTGKAAARMNESIRRQRDTLDCSEDVSRAIPAEASTIHRALGVVRGRTTRFYRNASDPLDTDVVLVDESSMVDAALMARLVAAVPPHARLILLGDKNQLASVEAGAVLGEICAAGLAQGYSQGLVASCQALAGDTLPKDAPRADRPGLGDCIVHLSQSRRYASGSGIEALARAIDERRPEDALAVLADPRFGDVSLHPHGPKGRPTAELAKVVTDGYRPYLELPPQASARERLEAFDRFRLLCAHRRGHLGVHGLNQLAQTVLRSERLLDPKGEVYPGRPVLVTRNDYGVRLFNGDVGLIVEDRASEGHPLRAFFLDTKNRERLLAPGRLPEHQTVFAMTVHKSQGSEFDHVCLVLPAQVSPALTRELLYTAVTRAKTRVTVFGSAEVLRAGVAARVERASGLRELLMAPT